VRGLSRFLSEALSFFKESNRRLETEMSELCPDVVLHCAATICPMEPFGIVRFAGMVDSRRRR
jgi:hypothetical protein